MDHDEKQRLARTGDVSNAAASFRLRAARESLEPRVSQKAMAEQYGVDYIYVGAAELLPEAHRNEGSRWVIGATLAGVALIMLMSLGLEPQV